MNLFSLFPAEPTINTRIPDCCHNYPDKRVVVGVLLFDDQGNLFLIEPRHSPHDRDWLICPQEKAKRLAREDKSLGGVALRCLREELGLSEEQVTLHPVALTKFLNPTPARHGMPATEKYIIVFGCYIPTLTEFKPNLDEVHEVVRVTADELLAVLPRRPVKFRGIIDACKAAVQQGLLTQPAWQNFAWL